MRHSIAFAVLLALVVMNPAVAQAAPTQRNAESPLDLAAMTLTPADLGQPGYGLDFSDVWTPKILATETARDRGLGSDVASAWTKTLTGDGLITHYRSDVALPQTSNPQQYAVVAASYIDEYNAADGAAKGFASLYDLKHFPAAKLEKGTRTVGDLSQLVRVEAAANDSTSFNEIELDFQIGKLVGGVFIRDFIGNAPAVADVERLAGILVDRMTKVVATNGPGLGNQTLRITRGATIYTDHYLRLGGKDFPRFNETDEGLVQRSMTFGDATDLYSARAGIRAMGDALYEARIYRFPSVASAAAYLKAAPDTIKPDPNAYGLASSPLSGLGDDAITVTWKERDSGGGPDANSIRIYVLIGNEVAMIHLSTALATVSPPLPDAAMMFAQAQTACLKITGVCPGIGVPGA